MWGMLSCFTEMFTAVKNGITGGGQQQDAQIAGIQRFGEQNQHIIINPTGQHLYTLIWLHGLGDSAEGYLDVFQNASQSPVCQNTKIVLLTAPIAKVTINLGMSMTSWFDFKSQDISEASFNQSIGINEIMINSNFITKIMAQEVEQLNGQSQNLFIGGFSQGGCMALHNGLQFDKTIGGIMVCSGFGFPITKESEANQKIPILIQHGTNDVLIPLKKSQPSYEKLNRENHNVQQDIFKGLDHGFCEDSWNKFRIFFQKYTQGQQIKA